MERPKRSRNRATTAKEERSRRGAEVKLVQREESPIIEARVQLQRRQKEANHGMHQSRMKEDVSKGDQGPPESGV